MLLLWYKHCNMLPMNLNKNGIMKQFVLSLCVCISMYAFGQNDSNLNIQRDTASHQITNMNVQPVRNYEHLYKLKPVVDIPIMTVGTAWSLFAFTKIYSKDSSTTAQILALNKNNIAGINRSAVNHYSPHALSVSNDFFYTSMPLPLILLVDKKIRKDIFRVTVLWEESMAITGLLYTGSVYFHDKYRPLTYNPNVPTDIRKRGGGKNSFFAGHVALVGTSTFFTAHVFCDYHPERKMKWLLYGAAGLATATVGYLRYEAGEHFPTDVFIGAAVGVLTGTLVPHLHKNVEHSKLSFAPYYNGIEKGVALNYRF